MDDWALPGFTEVRTLGDGTFGRVVLARENGTGGLVAIKYLFHWYLDPVRLAAFRREAQALRLLASPYLVQLHDFFEDPRGSAIVMEAVPGTSLRRLLNDNGPLKPEAALAVFKDSLLGLAAVHSAGVVHGDHKPANMLITADRQVKLADVGTALLAGEAAGTPAYLAPERWAGGEPTPSADIYAATCVFFESLTGYRPYRADAAEVLRSLHSHSPIPFGEVPEPLHELISRGMAKNPADRPSAEELLNGIELVAAAAYGKKWEEQARSSSVPEYEPEAKPGTWTKAGAIVLGVAVVAAGVVYLVNSGNDPSAPAPDPVVAAAPQTLSVVKTPVREQNAAFVVEGEVLQVHGYQDKAVGEQVDKALREPFDNLVHNSRLSPANGRTHTSRAQILLQDDQLLSVRYDNSYGEGAGYSETVTIALATGRPLDVRELLTPAALSATGLSTLEQRLGLTCARDLAETDFTGARPEQPEMRGSGAELALAPDGVVFVLRLGACAPETKTLAYARMADLLDPEVLKLLPDQRNIAAPSSAPSSSSAPPGKPLRFGSLNLTLPKRFSLRNQGLEKVVVDGDGCANPARYFDCRYFTVTDNTKANAEQPAYEPGQPYRRSANGRACNAVGRKDLKQTGASSLVEKAAVKIGDQDATYEKWTIRCVRPGSTESEAELTQRIWYLPAKQLVILDEWAMPDLDAALAKAVWR